jgi:hypothetical protein
VTISNALRIIVVSSSLNGGGAGFRDVLVALLAARAADADRTDHDPAGDDRHAALQRCEVVERHHRGAAALDDVLERRRRLLEEAAVRAFPVEIRAPAANVPSSRSRYMRLPPSSTTAIAAPS